MLYDDVSLDAAWDLVKDWNAAERQKLRDEVPRLGFNARIRSASVLDLAKECLTIAHAGLARRHRLDQDGRDETRYLAPLGDIVSRGKTAAEEMLDKFHGPWAGSIDPIYTEYVY